MNCRFSREHKKNCLNSNILYNMDAPENFETLFSFVHENEHVRETMQCFLTILLWAGVTQYRTGVSSVLCCTQNVTFDFLWRRGFLITRRTILHSNDRVCFKDLVSFTYFTKTIFQIKLLQISMSCYKLYPIFFCNLISFLFLTCC